MFENKENIFQEQEHKKENQEPEKLLEQSQKENIASTIDKERGEKNIKEEAESQRKEDAKKAEEILNKIKSGEIGEKQLAPEDDLNEDESSDNAEMKKETTMNRREFLKDTFKTTKGLFAGIALSKLTKYSPKNMNLLESEKLESEKSEGKKKYLKDLEKTMEEINKEFRGDGKYFTVDSAKIKQVIISKNFQNYLKNNSEMEAINAFSLAQAVVRRIESEVMSSDKEFKSMENREIKLARNSNKNGDIPYEDTEDTYENTADTLSTFYDLFSRHDVDFKKVKSLTINEAVSEVISGMEKFKKEKVVDYNTEIVAFVSDDSKGTEHDLNNICDRMGIKKTKRKIFKQTKNESASSDKSIARKKIELFLDNIEKSLGKTFIHITGHGGYYYDGYLDDNAISASKKVREYSQISIANLGEAIIKSENEKNITLAIESCGGYNFAQNLKYYLKLREAKMPKVIITAANKGHMAFGRSDGWIFFLENHGMFSSEMAKVANKKSGLATITGEDIIKMERKLWKYEDMSISISGAEKDKKSDLLEVSSLVRKGPKEDKGMA